MSKNFPFNGKKKRTVYPEKEGEKLKISHH